MDEPKPTEAHFIQFGPCMKCHRGTITSVPFKKPDIVYFWYCCSCMEGYTFTGQPIGEVRPSRDFGKEYS